MGNSVSAVEKASVEAILHLGAKAQEPLERSAVTDVLYWAKRRGLLQGTNEVFQEEKWKDIGQDIWEAVQTGSKEAKTLAPTYRKIRLLIERMNAEAELEAAARAVYTAAEEKFSAAAAALPVAAPVHKGPYDDLIPPWEPPDPAPPAPPPDLAMPTAPPMEVDPASVPLPEHTESSSLQSLSDMLKKQADVMTGVLNEMQRLDKGARSSTIKQAYKQAHDAIVTGLQNIDKQLESFSQPASPISKKRQLVVDYVKEGEWSVQDANHFLATKGEPFLTDVERSEIEEWQAKRPVSKKAMGPPSGLTSFLNKIWYGGTEPPPPQTDPVAPPEPPRDPSFDINKRWRGVITDAELSGFFQFTAAPAVHTNQGSGWQPLDWSFLSRLQKSVLDYGIDNRLVRRQVETVIKHQELIPAEIKTIFELILGPTSYMLFLTKWRERLEMRQLENISLPQGDPLRFASLDQLMGQGQFLDPQRQAALGPRVLGQSKAAALEAFNALPQVGKPRQPYLRIQQKDGEPFLAFLDRVKEGIEIAPDVPFDMKDTLVKEIAVQNANMACKRLIAALPPGASLMQLIEQCSRAPMEEEKEKARIHATALAVALQKTSKQGLGDKGPSTCYECGQPGHFKKACPKKKKPILTPLFSGVCKRCDKFGHKANECRSRFKKDGTPLQGNAMSREGSAAMKINSPISATTAAAALTPCMQQPPEAQELIW